MTKFLIFCILVTFAGCFSNGHDQTNKRVDQFPLLEDGAMERLSEIYKANFQLEMSKMTPTEGARIVSKLRDLGEVPGDLSLEMGPYGPHFLGGSFFKVTTSDLSSSRGNGPVEVANAFIREFGILWGLENAEEKVEAGLQEVDNLGWTHMMFKQKYSGLDVDGAVLVFHIDNLDSIRSIDGVLVPGIRIDISPSITDWEAIDVALAATGDSGASCTQLVVFVPLLNSMTGDPKLAFKVKTKNFDGMLAHAVYVDAQDGSYLADRPLSYYSLNRSLWDNNGRVSGCCSGGCQCTPSGCWRSGFTVFQPHFTTEEEVLQGCYPEPPDPPPPGQPCLSTCHNDIWHYQESTGCNGNGDPPGEPNCDSTMQDLWTWTGDVYNYWWSTFGRDSWDDAGGPMWTIGDAYLYGACGVAGQYDVSTSGSCTGITCDGIANNVSVHINTDCHSKWLAGHEYGHTLQIHDVEEASSSFYGQWGAIGEYMADIDGYRVADFWEPGGCGLATTGHWRLYKTVITDQSNKYIGDCSAWLLGQTEVDQDPGTPGYQYAYHGVTTTSLPLTDYEDIWYRTQKYYTTTYERYNTHRSDMVRSAQELFGTYSSQALQTFNAMDAIGTWTAEGYITQEYLVQDLRPAAGTVTGGGEERLYVFYRKQPASERKIYYRYLVTGAASWSAEYIFDDGTSYPIESEPVVALRQNGSVQELWVAWRNYNNNRIMARNISYYSGSWHISTAYGFNAYTVDSPAIASLNIGSPYERVYVVFRKDGNPTQLYYSYLGLSTPVSMGSSYRTDVAPSMVTYGTGSTKRLYVFFTGVEPDDDVYYGSYAYGGSWSSRVNVTDIYDAIPQVITGITRTEKPLALGVYGLTQTRLHVASLTISPQYETWMYALYETSPGVLGTYNQWAVPQRSSPGWSASAGSFGRSGDRWGHFFVEKYFLYWSTRGD
jgi:hypothetical protein